MERANQRQEVDTYFATPVPPPLARLHHQNERPPLFLHKRSIGGKNREADQSTNDNDPRIELAIFPRFLLACVQV